MKAPFSYLPALPAAIGIIAGILIFNWCLWQWALTSLLFGFLLLYFLKYHYPSFYLLSASAGILLAYAHTPKEMTCDDAGIKAIYKGVVEEITPNVSGKIVIVKIIEANSKEIDAIKCRLFIQDYIVDLEEGSTLQIDGTLLPLKVTTPLPYETDFSAYNKYKGITSEFKYGYTISSCDLPDRSSFRYKINRIRDKIFNAIVKSPINSNTAGFIVASVLGDKEFLDESVIESYKTTGIAHILALSGLHIGILASLIGIILFPLNVFRHGKTIKSLLTLTLIWLYAMIVGLPPSVMRAAIMISVVIISYILQRGYNIENCICIAITAVLAFDPFSIYTPGFQLSFAAVISIMLFSGMIPKSLHRHPIKLFALSSLLTPVAAMVGTCLILTFHFSKLPPFFLISNIAAGLFFPIILYGGVILTIFNMLGINFTLLGIALDFTYKIFSAVIDFISSWHESIYVYYHSLWAFIAFGVFIICAYAWIYKDKLKLSTFRTSLFIIISIEFFIITLILVSFSSKEKPVAELHIPISNPSAIIIGSGNSASIIKIDTLIDDDEILETYNNKYEGLLRNRGYGTSFNIIDKDTTLSHIIYLHNFILLDSISIKLLKNEEKFHKSYIHLNYAIATKQYDGSITEMLQYIHPDTLIIPYSTHPRRAKKWIKECGDSLPYIWLNDNFSIYAY